MNQKRDQRRCGKHERDPDAQRRHGEQRDDRHPHGHTPHCRIRQAVGPRRERRDGKERPERSVAAAERVEALHATLSSRRHFRLQVGDRRPNDGGDEPLVEENRRDLEQPRPWRHGFTSHATSCVNVAHARSIRSPNGVGR